MLSFVSQVNPRRHTSSSDVQLLKVCHRRPCQSSPGSVWVLHFRHKVERAARATPDERSMAPSERRKTSAAPEPVSGNATQGVRTRRFAGERDDLPDARDADLDAEPEVLLWV